MDTKLTLDRLRLDDLPAKPTVAIVTGSGVQLPYPAVSEVMYSEIPRMPTPRTPGHEGKLRVVEVDQRFALVFVGRPHAYEGFTYTELSYPVHLMASLGITDVIFTNAVGSLNETIGVGAVVQVSDVIRPMGSIQPTAPYPSLPTIPCLDTAWRAATLRYATNVGCALQQGVYVQTLGPQYETRSEIGMFRRIGAQLIGMSSAVEAVLAYRLGLRVQILSLVTNLLSTVHTPVLSHDHVLDVAATYSTKVSTAIRSAIFAA